MGGEGQVKSLYPDSGTWIYVVEMASEPVPVLDRIGDETTVLLKESDLWEGIEQFFPVIA